MAETLTVDTTPQTETLTDNLTPDEQDALKVGEEMVSQQEQLLAGKYRNAEELEKAYAELERKLGEKDNKNNEAVDEAEISETEEVSEEKDEATDFTEGAQTIMSASDEYYQNDGKLSEETLNKFTQMSSRDLVEAYMAIYENQPETVGQDQNYPDLSDSDMNQVYSSVGGEAEYGKLTGWAAENLDDRALDAFNSIVDQGNPLAIQIAVAGLKSEYDNAEGYEGRMLTGKAAQTSNGFRSQAEVVQAMNDPRYDTDPAYRQDIYDKLERSNVNF